MSKIQTKKCLWLVPKREHNYTGRIISTTEKDHSSILVTQDLSIRRCQERAQEFILGFTEDSWGKGVPSDSMVPN